MVKFIITELEQREIWENRLKRQLVKSLDIRLRNSNFKKSLW